MSMETMPQPEQNKDQLTLDLEKKEAFAEAWSAIAIENGYTQKEDDGKKKVFEKGDQTMTVFVSSVNGGFATFYYPEVPLIKPANISFTYNGDTSLENTKKLFQESQKKFATRYNQIVFAPIDKEFNQKIIGLGSELGYTAKKINNGRTVLTRGVETVIFQHVAHNGPNGERYVIIEKIKDGKSTTTALQWGPIPGNDPIDDSVTQGLLE